MSTATLSGVLAYGDSREAAIVRAEALALRVLAGRIEHGEPVIAKRTGLEPGDM